MSLKAVIEEFTDRLHALIEGQAVERARAAVLSAFGVHSARMPGRPPKAAMVAGAVTKKARKKVPRQLCPVPGCKNTAAPVFGMVCAKHTDVAKSKIKKYREARKAKRLGLKAPARNGSKNRAQKRISIKRRAVAEAATTPKLAG